MSKIVEKTPDDRGGNRGKPWSIEMRVSLVALRDYRPTRKQDEGGGRRLVPATTALMSPPMHRRSASKANLKNFLGLEFRGGPEL